MHCVCCPAPWGAQRREIDVTANRTGSHNADIFEFEAGTEHIRDYREIDSTDMSDVEAVDGFRQARIRAPQPAKT